jgi:predicted AAA+ superfamily ATPase
LSDEFEIADRSFFLFGPRGVGKTTWLKNVLPEAVYFDLLDASLFLELSQNRNRPIFFYRTGAGSEMDFIIETRKRRQSTIAHIVCLEVKLAEKWVRKWERPIRSLSTHKNTCVDKMVGIYTSSRAYHFDGIKVLPLTDFLGQLHLGQIF